jgi:hypothetical protein
MARQEKTNLNVAKRAGASFFVYIGENSQPSDNTNEICKIAIYQQQFHCQTDRVKTSVAFKQSFLLKPGYHHEKQYASVLDAWSKRLTRPSPLAWNHDVWRPNR